MVPVSIEKYYFNMSRANEMNEPLWEFAYEFKEEYNLKDLSPKSIKDMAETVRNDEATAMKVHKNMHAQGIAADKITKCDDKCQKHLYCEMTSGHYFGMKDCMGENHINIIKDPTGFFEIMADPWIEGPAI